jgi:peptidoglycan/LPS O-acetylase OafA/YrhL
LAAFDTYTPPAPQARADARFDGFDLLRIAAAVVVVFWHAYPLTGRPNPVIPLLGRAGATYGSLAVGAFFAMSGFLITASWSRARSPRSYLRNRVVRIWPGLVVAVAVTAFVVGPLVTTLPLGSYLGSPETLGYWAHTSLLAPPLYQLPGVFAHNPYAIAVNGSLWTLPYEALFYVGVLALGFLGLLRRREFALGVAVASATLHMLVVDTQAVESSVRFTFDLNHVAQLGLSFFIGAACFAYFEDLVARRRRWVCAAIATVLLGAVGGFLILVSIGVAVLMIAAGTMSWNLARRIRRYGDPSYGTYIYGFLIQQVLAGQGWVSTPETMFLVAAPLSLFAGYASWHLVEYPAIRWSKRARRASVRR